MNNLLNLFLFKIIIMTSIIKKKNLVLTLPVLKLYLKYFKHSNCIIQAIVKLIHLKQYSIIHIKTNK